MTRPRKKPESSKRRSAKDRPLTTRERRLVQGVAGGLPVTKAAVRAGYTPSTATSRVYDVMRKPAVRNALVAEMERQGLTDKLLVRKLRENLDAKRVTRTTYKGRVYSVHKDRDSSEIRETTRLIALLRGDLASETRPADQTVQINFVSNLSLEPFRAARAKALAAMHEQEAEDALVREPLTDPEDHQP
jgi:DNA-binding CsgD family transcriptional regulator